ncbi:hypothetical protein AYO46_10590 [Betaproteobacteria bacterium SCGC AG-212-J23]|nr:hypothetical protein AYO46_10590 [Betaproteobacteria bacterium SCGC AG-212-J23]
MNRIFLLIVVMGFAASAAAQQFRWVDKDGRVQYGDTPPPGVKATRLKPPPAGTAPSPSSAAKKDGEKGLSPDAAFRKRQEERAAEEKKSAQASAEADMKRQNCESAQAQLRTIQSGQRMSSTNQQGERVFLDDAQIAAERTRAEQAVSSFCN